MSILCIRICLSFIFILWWTFIQKITLLFTFCLQVTVWAYVCTVKRPKYILREFFFGTRGNFRGMRLTQPMLVEVLNLFQIIFANCLFSWNVFNCNYKEGSVYGNHNTGIFISILTHWKIPVYNFTWLFVFICTLHLDIDFIYPSWSASCIHWQRTLLKSVANWVLTEQLNCLRKQRNGKPACYEYQPDQHGSNAKSNIFLFSLSVSQCFLCSFSFLDWLSLCCFPSLFLWGDSSVVCTPCSVVCRCSNLNISH